MRGASDVRPGGDKAPPPRADGIAVRRIPATLLAALLAAALLVVPAWADHDGGPPADPAAPGQVAGDDWEDDGWDGQNWDVEDGGDAGVAATPAAPWDDGGKAIPIPVPAPAIPLPPLPTGATVPGKVARVRADGKAAVPRGAPKRVRRVIAAANQIVGRPYKWGGGHARLVDSGYDCSGAVGYALIRAGILRSVMVSGQMARWASGGAGRWISVHANKGHVYMEVAGLRLDTSPVGDPAGRDGVRWRPVIGRRGGFHTRHPVGL